jgi:hypothetical protein
MASKQRNHQMSKRIRGEPFWVAGALLFGLVLSLTYFAIDPIRTSPDSYDYMRGGISIWSGQGFQSMSGGAQLLFPPFYPFTIGALNCLLHDPLLSARLISLVSSLVAILLVYFIARTLVPGIPAVIAAWLFALLPLRIWLSSMAWSESIFGLLVLAATLLWIGPSRGWVRASFCGLALGAAYLTRPEGFLVFAVLVVGGAIRVWHEQKRARIVLFRALPLLIGFLLLASPYLLYLKAHKGKWQLTGKADVNLAIASQLSAEVPFSRLRTLSDDNREVNETRQGMDLRSVLRRTARNTRMALGILTDTVSPFLLIMVGMGLATAWWRGRVGETATILLALAIPSLIVPFFFIQERMLIMICLVAILLAGPAFALNAPDIPERQGRLLGILAGLLAVCTAVWMAAGSPIRQMAAAPTQPGERLLRRALEREQDTQGAILGNGQISRALAFETGRNHLFLPWEPLDRVLQYAEYRKAVFLIVQSTDHPELAALARNPKTTQMLTPLARYEMKGERDRGVIQLYRITPENAVKGEP